MRSATHFTLHAILAACLAALAASSAAAAGPTGGKEEVYFTITLTDARAADGAHVGRNDGRLESFEIKDWSFDKVSKVDSFTVKQGVKPVGTADVTMKRGTGPSTAPPPSGSFRVKVRFPWLGCRVGARYPSLALNGGGKSYLLQDVQVADCGPAGSPVEEVGFVYGKVTVRGWDPEKKEQ